MPREIGIDDRGVHVALATYGAGIAQLRGDRVDGARHTALSLGRRRGRLERAQGAGAENRACPGAEILAGESLAGDRADVVVHVGRLDRPARAVLVDVAEENGASRPI